MSAAEIETAPEAQATVPVAETSRPRRQREVLAIIALVILALLTCCCTAWSQFEKVPDVVGMTEEEARAALEEAGFKLEVAQAEDGAGASGDGAAGPAGAPGTVTVQSPGAGKRALAGTTVTITISGGSSAATDGDGTGSDSEQDGADGSGGTGAVGDTAAANIDGDGSETFDPASRFTNISSSGGSGPQVPAAQNVSESAARRILEAAGYRMIVGGYGPTTAGVTEGNVYYQEPAPGSGLPRGSAVTVWISTGAPHKDGYEGIPYPGPTNP